MTDDTQFASELDDVQALLRHVNNHPAFFVKDYSVEDGDPYAPTAVEIDATHAPQDDGD